LILKNEAHSPDDSDMTLVILCVTSLHRYIVNAGEGDESNILFQLFSAKINS